MCSNPATSYEHAPPRCIFPALKDSSDATNRRQNLIKVPSCHEHNSAKSKDDEYLLYILSLSVTSNSIGHNQALSKVKRASVKRPALLSALNSKALPTTIKNLNTGDTIDVIALFPDGNRINTALENCARALYFHETGKKFNGRAKVVNGFLIDSVENSEKKLQAFSMIEAGFAKNAYLGSNQDTFKYKVDIQNESAMFLFEFYGSAKVIIDLRPCKE